MKTYDCLCINISFNGIYLVCTDENTVKWIDEQIEKLSPNAKLSKTEDLYHLPQTKNLIRRFEKLDDKDFGIGLYLVQQLCHNEWEPVGNIKFYAGHIEDITLRKCHET